jgi:lipopolysaccharide transport system permease protein
MSSASWVVGRAIVTNRSLLCQLVLRELEESVVGSAFGRFWLYLTPLLTMAIYIFIFAVVFRARMPEGAALSYGYSAYILAGLIPWMMTSEVMNKSCTAIISHANLVKEVVFPIEILPAKAVLSSAMNYLVFYGIYLVYVLAAHHELMWTHLLLPVVLGIQILFLIGIALIFSAVTPFFRDWARLVGLSGMLLIYAAPIVYVQNWVPPLFKPLIYVNPISYMAWCFQDTLFYGEFAHPLAWTVFPALAVLCFAYGAWLFRRLYPLFGNVL